MTGKTTAWKGTEGGRRGLGWALVSFTVLSWGSLVIMLKLLIPEIDPFTVTWYRLAFGAILILAFSGGSGRLEAHEARGARKNP